MPSTINLKKTNKKTTTLLSPRRSTTDLIKKKPELEERNITSSQKKKLPFKKEISKEVKANPKKTPDLKKEKKQDEIEPPFQFYNSSGEEKENFVKNFYGNPQKSIKNKKTKNPSRNSKTSNSYSSLYLNFINKVKGLRGSLAFILIILILTVSFSLFGGNKAYSPNNEKYDLYLSSLNDAFVALTNLDYQKSQEYFLAVNQEVQGGESGKFGENIFLANSLQVSGAQDDQVSKAVDMISEAGGNLSTFLLEINDLEVNSFSNEDLQGNLHLLYEGDQLESTSDHADRNEIFSENFILLIQAFQLYLEEASAAQEMLYKNSNGNQTLEELSAIISKQNELIKFFLDNEDLFRMLLGLDEEENFLFLLSDEAVVRPIGGKIINHSFVRVKDGSAFSSDNMELVYDYDKTTEDMPEILRDMYGEWSLENFNWNMDYEESSKKLLEIIDPSTSDEISGVVMMSRRFLKDILESSNSQSIANENPDIASDNMDLLLVDNIGFTKIMKYVFNDFISGEDVVGSIFKSLFFVVSRIESQDLHIYSKDSTIQEKVRKLNPDRNNIIENDNFVRISRFNLDQGRYSNQLSEAISLQSNIKENSIENLLKIEYDLNIEEKNNIENSDYISLYLPANIEVISFEGFDNSTESPIDKYPTTQFKAEVNKLEKYTIISGIVNTNNKGEEVSHISIKYKSPLNIDDVGRYTFYKDKSPNFSSSSFDHSLNTGDYKIKKEEGGDNFLVEGDYYKSYVLNKSFF